ncbi:SKI family transcriptional corepressor 1 homolog-B [Oncorhynchus nerka]|uniref:SKI family transcriptional corepressor 1 homolog-B n=1 Tax=Oncorhynchus nerka TaxID=8023 RepID=UPI0031B8A6AE
MECNPPQLPATRDSSCSPPSSKQDLPTFNPNMKPNQVSETALYGIPIVCLVLDRQERLCLAQISNTLLKNYSYNEIHNRRVALGITCVQCTPVQLEILRRAGAMPISSRRCGMITKREAERLCKSFIGAHNPPKLPENFAFDVSHECTWGSRGNFIPARYNSSRAKCIKCSFCNMYFSPNKFIFHSHRTSESKYTQPDAANFNSWRRHLKLTDKGSPDDLAHAWEDVKAMFNGGSRKRTLPMHRHGPERSSPLKPHQGPSNLPRRGSPEIPPKILRCEDNRGGMGTIASITRSYPIIPVPSKSYGMLQNVKIPPPLFPHPYGFPAFGLCQKKDDSGVMGEPNKAHLSGVFSWPSTKDSAYHSFPMFWPTADGLSIPSFPQPQHQAQPHHQAQPKQPSEVLCARQSELDASEQSDRNSNTPKDSVGDGERCSSTQSTRDEDDKSGDEARSMNGKMPVLPRKISYVSAFRPVIKDAKSIAKLYGNRGKYNGARAGYLSPDFLSESSSYRSLSPGSVESVGETDVDVETNKSQDDEESLPHSIEDCRSPPVPVLSLSRGAGSPNGLESIPESEQAAVVDSQRMNLPIQVVLSSNRDRHGKQLPVCNKTTSFDEVYSPDRSSPYAFGSATNYQTDNVKSKDDCASREEPSSTVKEVETKSYKGQSREEGPREALNEGEEATHNVSIISDKHRTLAKDELQKQLTEQVELRKKLEREFQHLKDNFNHQMKRELSYREEMVQQLHIVREAHDALHQFSCKMLTPRHCTGTCSFKPPLLPP